jgi:hypothetical protein
MRNCVGSYGPKVRQGEVYIYHLDLPGEACTLSLGRGKGARPAWGLRELKAFANRQPSSRAQKAVIQWLKSNQIEAAVEPQQDLWDNPGFEQLMAHLGVGP